MKDLRLWRPRRLLHLRRTCRAAVEGSGTLVIGGKLKDEKRTNAENLTGSGVDGGTPRKIAKGDWVMVPEKTPHWFQQIDGTIVLMSIHLPHAPTTTPSR